MPSHPYVIASLVIALAGGFAALVPCTGRWTYLRNVAIGIATLSALMALGALFGRVLGDFLREVN